MSEEDIVGDVRGFELVGTDGAVGGAQVAGFPGLVEGRGRLRGSQQSYSRPAVRCGGNRALRQGAAAWKQLMQKESDIDLALAVERSRGRPHK